MAKSRTQYVEELLGNAESALSAARYLMQETQSRTRTPAEGTGAPARGRGRPPRNARTAPTGTRATGDAAVLAAINANPGFTEDQLCRVVDGYMQPNNVPATGRMTSAIGRLTTKRVIRKEGVGYIATAAELPAARPRGRPARQRQAA